jgi:cytochrome c
LLVNRHVFFYPAALVLVVSAAACSKQQPDDGNGPAAQETSAPIAYASLKGDAVHGEKVFAQCKACHVLDPGQNRVGPSLHGIVGRTAGQVPGYTYSAANTAANWVWTEEKLYAFLEAPQKVMPGTRMSYYGMKDAQDRADLIAYLKTAS